MPSRTHSSSFSLLSARYFHIRMELQMILPSTEMGSECFPRVDKQVRTSCQASLSWYHGPYGIVEVGNICMRNRYCSLTVTTHRAQRSATYPPRFPIPTTIAMTTPLFIAPPAFPPDQAKLTATVGYTPVAAMIAAA